MFESEIWGAYFLEGLFFEGFIMEMIYKIWNKAISIKPPSLISQLPSLKAWN